jgi:hypothetical protein
MIQTELIKVRIRSTQDFWGRHPSIPSPMPLVGFEPTIPVIERSKTGLHILGTSIYDSYKMEFPATSVNHTGTGKQVLNMLMPHFYTPLELNTRAYTLPCYICTLRWNWTLGPIHLHATSVHYAGTEHWGLYTSMLHLYTTLELSTRAYTLPCYICTLHWNWAADRTHFHAATSTHYTVSDQSALHIYSAIFLLNIFSHKPIILYSSFCVRPNLNHFQFRQKCTFSTAATTL